MKCLFLPLNVPGSEQHGQSRGMHEVFDEVVEFDYLNSSNPNGELLRIAAQGFDVAWMQLQDTRVITAETLREVKKNVKFMTQWNGDIREIIPAYQLDIAPLFDVTYLGFDHLEQYRKIGANPKLMMIAVDPTEVEPTQSPVMPLFDVTFIGNHYEGQFPDSSTRLELIKVLKAKFNTKVLGNGWPDGIADGNCPVKEQSNWYANSRVALSINHFNNIKYYSERLLWCLGSGTPTVAMRTPDLEFIEDAMYLGFNDTNECVRQIEFLLQYPGLSHRIGQLGQQEVIKNHNWTERFKHLRSDYVTNQHE